VTQTEAQSDRRAVAAAVFAGTCSVLSTVFILFAIGPDIDYPAMIVLGINLAPLLVVIIGRHVAAIAFTYAWLLFFILLGWAISFPSSVKFVLADLLGTLVGIVSVFFLLMLAAKYLEILVANALKRRSGPNMDG